MARKSKWDARPLGPLQAAVMGSLWRDGPQSAADLHETLSADQDWAYTTIHTELSRLLRKGLAEKRGRNLETRYAATMTRDEYLQATVRQTISDLISTHGAAAIHGFVELVASDEASFEELRRVLGKRPRKR